MSTIAYQTIVSEIAGLCLKAAYNLPEDTVQAVTRALASEGCDRARFFLNQYLENAAIAAREQLPICQDTGIALYFVERGEDLRIEGGSLEAAISEGTAKGYQTGCLRKSMVSDPLFLRKNTGDNTPPIIHTKVVERDGLGITLVPKGGGAENMSALAMLKPAQGREGVVDFVSRTAIDAGGNPCPPTIVGVGIGGTFELCACLAKKALLRDIGTANPDARYAELEQDILARINDSRVGPQGLGGDTTAFAVHIEYFPCHIACLPVAVNLNCHAARHAHVFLAPDQS